jgi:hypothetical protein
MGSMSASGHKGEIEIRARVVEYHPHALMDHFTGGGHQSFGATTLEVLAPSRLNGSRLAIYHDPPAAESSPWRKVGAVLTFTIDEDLLAEGGQIFSGAANNLRAVS